MSVSKRNLEGYMDLTAYEALRRIEGLRHQMRGYMPLVYICSPFSGAVERNIRKAAKFCRFAVDQGCIPIAPHILFPQFMDDDIQEEHDLALYMDIVLLTKCQELWVFGDIISEGMAMEIAKAKSKGQVIRYFNNKCKEIFI